MEASTVIFSLGKGLVSILSGGVTIAAMGGLVMGVVFMIPGHGKLEDYQYLDKIFYGAFLLFPLLGVLNIWGQIKFWAGAVGEPKWVSLAMMFSPALLVGVFFVLAFTLLNK